MMTYDLREESLQSGEPIELYHFQLGHNNYRYTSAQHQVNVLGEIWESAFLKRDQVEYSAEKGRNNLKVECPRTFAIADLYRLMPPSDMILFTLYRVHQGDADAIVIWSGRLLNVEFAGAKATLVCQPITTSLKRTGLRRLYQRQCPHILYGESCQLNKATVAVVANLSAIDNTTLRSASFGLYANGYFTGGYLEFLYQGVLERRFIIEHRETQLTMNMPVLGLNVGSDIKVYPGCDHTMSTCKNTFNNLNNYGGFPYIPSKNPFGGNGIY